MTDKPAAFTATYSDFKVVRTRDSAQFIFEVPLRAADYALNVLGGVPQPMEERWVAIARLTQAPDPSAHGAVVSEPETVKP